MSEVRFKISDVVRRSGLEIRVRVEGIAAFRLRTKLAILIMRVAGFVSPVPLSIDVCDEARA